MSENNYHEKYGYNRIGSTDTTTDKVSLTAPNYFTSVKYPYGGSKFSLGKHSIIDDSYPFSIDDSAHASQSSTLGSVNDQIWNRVKTSQRRNSQGSGSFPFPIINDMSFGKDNKNPFTGFGGPGAADGESVSKRFKKSIENFHTGSENQYSVLDYTGKNAPSFPSSNLGQLGFYMEDGEYDPDDESEMGVARGFKYNGSVPGIEYRVVAPHGCSAPGKYDLVFIGTTPLVGTMDTFESSYLNRLQGFGRNFAATNGYSLASLNYHFAMLQHYTTDPSKATTQQEFDDLEKEFEDHKNLIANIRLLGVCDTERGFDGTATFVDETTVRTDIQDEKYLNVLIEGQADTKNIWGPVSGATQLFLVWKKVDMKGKKYMVDIRNSSRTRLFGNSNPSVSVTSATKTISTSPFQLVPYACDFSNSVPREVLEYNSDHLPNTLRKSMRKYIGKSIYVGMVSHADSNFINRGNYRLDAERLDRQTKAMTDYDVGATDTIKCLLEMKIQGGEKIVSLVSNKLD